MTIEYVQEVGRGAETSDEPGFTLSEDIQPGQGFGVFWVFQREALPPGDITTSAGIPAPATGWTSRVPIAANGELTTTGTGILFSYLFGVAVDGYPAGTRFYRRYRGVPSTAPVEVRQAAVAYAFSGDFQIAPVFPEPYAGEDYNTFDVWGQGNSAMVSLNQDNSDSLTAEHVVIFGAAISNSPSGDTLATPSGWNALPTMHDSAWGNMKVFPYYQIVTGASSYGGFSASLSASRKWAAQFTAFKETGRLARYGWGITV